MNTDRNELEIVTSSSSAAQSELTEDFISVESRRWRLSAITSDLLRAMEKTLHREDPIRRRFEFEKKQEIDNFIPTEATLNLLYEAFKNLPDAKRRTILNGWEHPGDVPDLADIARCYEPSASMEIIPDKPGKTSAGIGWTFTEGLDPVRMTIAVGTSKATVLEAIAELDRFIRTYWETLIVEPAAAIEADASVALEKVEQEAKSLRETASGSNREMYQYRPDRARHHAA